MTKAPAITCVFLDIGGVLLTNGWDHHARRRAAKNFKLEWAEMEDRHHLNFETYEEGKLTLEEYLGRVVFYQKRPFTRAQFQRFMFAQSKPYPEMIDMSLSSRPVRTEDRRGQQRSARTECVSDSKVQARRICGFLYFLLLRPTPQARRGIFRLALDIAQAPARQIVYIENTPMFVQIAEGLGIRSILHTDYKSTCAKLASFGLQNEASHP